MSEAAMRVIPNILAILAIQDRKMSAVILFGQLGKENIDRARREMPKAWQHLRLLNDMKAGRLGQPDHWRFGNNGATCPIFVPGARRPQEISPSNFGSCSETPSCPRICPAMVGITGANKTEIKRTDSARL